MNNSKVFLIMLIVSSNTPFYAADSNKSDAIPFILESERHLYEEKYKRYLTLVAEEKTAAEAPLKDRMFLCVTLGNSVRQVIMYKTKTLEDLKEYCSLELLFQYGVKEASIDSIGFYFDCSNPDYSDNTLLCHIPAAKRSTMKAYIKYT